MSDQCPPYCVSTCSILLSITTPIILNMVGRWRAATGVSVVETYHLVSEISCDDLALRWHMTIFQTSTAIRHVLWQTCVAPRLHARLSLLHDVNIIRRILLQRVPWAPNWSWRVSDTVHFWKTNVSTSILTTASFGVSTTGMEMRRLLSESP